MMIPEIYIAGSSYQSYYLALLTGIVVGWFAFFLSEDILWKQHGLINFLRIFSLSSFYYTIIMLCCIQGASYFHFVFDHIPEHTRRNLTLKVILMTNPVGSIKVLYGAIFFYPIGIFLISLNNLREKFIPCLDGKTFVLFLVVGFNRVGCFLNGCCYGIQSNLLGINFPSNSAVAYEHWKRGLTPGSFNPSPSLPVIPTQLIEAIFLFALSFFSWRSVKRGEKDIFVRFVLFYAVFRFFIEFIRDDMDRAYWLIFSASQWLSLMIFVAFAYRLYRRKSRDATV